MGLGGFVTRSLALACLSGKKESENISIASTQVGLAASTQPIGAIDQERWVDQTNPAYGPISIK